MSWHYSDQWAAGFFDGEGCVTISRRDRSPGFKEHFLAVQVGQNNKRPLEVLHARFGGCFTKSGCWRWRCHGSAACRFLQAIGPYSLVKRREVDLALELRALIGIPGRRVSPATFLLKEDIYRRFLALRDEQCHGIF